MGQHESKLHIDGVRALLQALNDRDQDYIDQCLRHKSVKKVIDNKVKTKVLTNLRVQFTDDIKDITCLGYASGYNDVRTVQQLVKAGADVSAVDSRRWSPLHWACASKTDVKHKAKYLLSCDESLIKARAKNNDTPLHVASITGNDAVISVLIRHGAKVNERGEFGRTALHYACCVGHVACIHELVRHGADVEARDTGRREATPLQLAASFNRLECIKALLDYCGASINAANQFGYTALHRAAFKGNLEVVKLLTAYSQCDVSAKDIAGNTAADLAIEQRHHDVVDYLTSQSEGTCVTSALPSQQPVTSGISLLASCQTFANMTPSPVSKDETNNDISCLKSTHEVPIGISTVTSHKSNGSIILRSFKFNRN